VRSLVPIIVAAAVLPVGTASAAATARTLSFTKLLHGSAPVKGPFQLPLGTTALVIDSAETAPSSSDSLLDEGSVAAIQRTPWRRRFVLGIFSTWPTRGYGIAVRRITVQQIGGGLEQLCVVAAVKTPAPGRVVLQERTSVYDLVLVARDPAGSGAPHAVVVRGRHGRLLYWTRDGRPVRPDVCHAA
jgi:hypothetical protein